MLKTSGVPTGAETGRTAAVPGRYFVASGHGGGWLVFREGTSQAVHRLPVKSHAIQTARILARSNSPSEVMVEQHNGTFMLAYNFDQNSEVRGY